MKTKSTKKKYLGRDKAVEGGDSDQDESVAAHSEATETSSSVFMSRPEIAAVLQQQSGLATDCSPEFTDAIAAHLYRSVHVVELC